MEFHRTLQLVLERDVQRIRQNKINLKTFELVGKECW